MQIINWEKYNTYKFWPGMFFTLCHPVYAWKYDRHCYGSFPWSVANFFRRKIWTYLPFSKASRWLANKLIIEMVDTKYLDDFYCRKSGGYSTYYRARGLFGHYVLYKIYNKPMNKMVKITVPNGLREDGTLNNKELQMEEYKPIKTVIVRGWCWRKKTAIALYKKIVIDKWDLYHSKWQPKPEVAHPWVMTIVENMKALLLYGKFSTTEYLDSSFYNDRFMKSKDKIEKLWCYVAYLLSCPNDFMAHEKLAWIFKTCDNYLYYKEMKTRPEIDDTYNQTLEKIGLKEAKKWQNQQVKAHTFVQMHTKLMEQIHDLEEFYTNQPFDYYRV